MTERIKCDVVIVGGGVIGMSIAFEAVRRGLCTAVVSVDKAGSATPASGGMITAFAEPDVASPAFVDLAIESCRAYPSFVEAIERASGSDCGYRQCGTLIVAIGRDHLVELDQLQRFQMDLGQSCEWLDRNQMRQREPRLTPRQNGGLHAKDDHRIDPQALLDALRVALSAQGALLVGDATSTAIRIEARRAAGVDVTRAAGALRIDAAATVLAAGVWSNEAVENPGVPELPLRPVRGQTVTLRGPALLDAVVRTPDVYLVPRGERLVIGASVEEKGFDTAPSAGVVLDLLRHAFATVPGIADLELLGTRVGFRPALPDHHPAIGPTDRDSLWIATGHHRHGVTLAPITARLVVDGLVANRAPRLLEPFSPHRFAKPRGATCTFH